MRSLSAILIVLALLVGLTPSSSAYSARTPTPRPAAIDLAGVTAVPAPRYLLVSTPTTAPATPENRVRGIDDFGPECDPCELLLVVDLQQGYAVFWLYDASAYAPFGQGSYVAFANNPLVFRDPSGLAPKWAEQQAQALARSLSPGLSPAERGRISGQLDALVEKYPELRSLAIVCGTQSPWCSGQNAANPFGLGFAQALRGGIQVGGGIASLPGAPILAPLPLLSGGDNLMAAHHTLSTGHAGQPLGLVASEAFLGDRAGNVVYQVMQASIDTLALAGWSITTQSMGGRGLIGLVKPGGVADDTLRAVYIDAAQSEQFALALKRYNTIARYLGQNSSASIDDIVRALGNDVTFRRVGHAKSALFTQGEHSASTSFWLQGNPGTAYGTRVARHELTHLGAALNGQSDTFLHEIAVQAATTPENLVFAGGLFVVVGTEVYWIAQ